MSKGSGRLLLLILISARVSDFYLPTKATEIPELLSLAWVGAKEMNAIPIQKHKQLYLTSLQSQDTAYVPQW